MERKRTVHQLDTPFSAVEWPQISQSDQDVILELLTSLLLPLGQYREAYIQPSEGKRNKSSGQDRKQDGGEGEVSVPPAPPLAAQVDVGLASISRHLEKLSAGQATKEPLRSGTEESLEASQKPYSVVFVLRSQHSAAFHAHFPQLIATASQHLPPEHSIRLVGFSKASEEILSRCLGIPRVSSIALRTDLPQAKAVIEFVREYVPPIQAGWLHEARSGGDFLKTKINAIETKVGVKKQRCS